MLFHSALQFAHVLGEAIESCPMAVLAFVGHHEIFCVSYRGFFHHRSYP